MFFCWNELSVSETFTLLLSKTKSCLICCLRMNSLQSIRYQIIWKFIHPDDIVKFTKCDEKRSRTVGCNIHVCILGSLLTLQSSFSTILTCGSFHMLPTEDHQQQNSLHTNRFRPREQLQRWKYSNLWTNSWCQIRWTFFPSDTSVFFLFLIDTFISCRPTLWECDAIPVVLLDKHIISINLCSFFNQNVHHRWVVVIPPYPLVTTNT